MKRSSLLIALSSCMVSTSVLAGAFLNDTRFDETGRVQHSQGSDSPDGVSVINVCISPSSLDIDDIEPSVINAVNTWQAMFAGINNLKRNVIPSNQVSHESVVLHEIGHAVGLAHPNHYLGSGASVFATSRAYGLDSLYTLLRGSDGVFGSHDDPAGDDLSRHRFASGVNNPFVSVGPVVDSTTYVTDLSQLPAGHSFATNANRNTSASMGYGSTEAVMFNTFWNGETKLGLTHDDVDTLRFAMSGVDEIQGTEDDYTMEFNYLGVISHADCNITIRQINTASAYLGYASNSVVGVSGKPTHTRVRNSIITMNANVNWHYSEASEPGPDPEPDPEPGVSSISGLVWADNDLDGIRGDVEPGYDMVDVHLLDLANNVLDTAVTDDAGEYNFSGLAAGSYRIRVFLPGDGFAGFTSPGVGTDPLIDSDVGVFSGVSDPLSVSGEDLVGINAGLVMAYTELGCPTYQQYCSNEIQSAQLRLDNKGRVRFSGRGTVTAEELGNPTVDTNYLACTYLAGTLVFETSIPASSIWTYTEKKGQVSVQHKAKSEPRVEARAGEVKRGRINYSHAGVSTLEAGHTDGGIRVYTSEGACIGASFEGFPKASKSSKRGVSYSFKRK